MATPLVHTGLQIIGRDEASASARMPPEMIHQILDYLPDEDIRKFLRVSRGMRATAAHHPRCFIIAAGWESQDLPSLMRKMEGVVSHAIAHRVQISLRFDLLVHQPGGDDAVYNKLADIVVRALPMTVELLLGLPLERSNFAALDRIWAVPAPVLRRFDLKVKTRRLRDPRPMLPEDLFAGIAPRLTYISLHLCRLESKKIVAFSRVVRADLLRVISEAPLAIYFPSLRQLAYQFDETTEVDFRGLSLESLDIKDSHDQPHPPMLDLTRIPNITIYGMLYCGTDRLWQGLPGQLEMFVGRATKGNKVLSLATFSWPQQRRTAISRLDFYLTVRDVKDYLPRLVFITITSNDIGPLIRTGATMPVLRRIQIEMYLDKIEYVDTVDSGDEERSIQTVVRWDGVDSTSAGFRLSCPALNVVRVCSTFESPRCALAAPGAIISLIGQCLGQLERPRHRRVPLEMVGAVLDRSSPEGVGTVFPNITYLPFDFSCSRAIRELIV